MKSIVSPTICKELIPHVPDVLFGVDMIEDLVIVCSSVNLL